MRLLPCLLIFLMVSCKPLDMTKEKYHWVSGKAVSFIQMIKHKLGLSEARESEFILKKSTAKLQARGADRNYPLTLNAPWPLDSQIESPRGERLHFSFGVKSGLVFGEGTSAQLLSLYKESGGQDKIGLMKGSLFWVHKPSSYPQDKLLIQGSDYRVESGQSVALIAHNDLNRETRISVLDGEVTLFLRGKPHLVRTHQGTTFKDGSLIEPPGAHRWTKVIDWKRASFSVLSKELIKSLKEAAAEEKAMEAIQEGSNQVKSKISQSQKGLKGVLKSLKSKVLGDETSARPSQTTQAPKAAPKSGGKKTAVQKVQGFNDKTKELKNALDQIEENE